MNRRRARPSASTAANSSQATNNQANFRQALNQLFSDVSSGSLSDAQDAYSTLSDLQGNGQGPSAASNTPLSQTLNQIGQSLQNGDISGAQQALASLQQTQQGQQGPTSPRRRPPSSWSSRWWRQFDLGHDVEFVDRERQFILDRRQRRHHGLGQQASRRVAQACR
jgi:hypothetical protein